MIDHLNKKNANIQFTKETFLDCLVSLDNNELRTIVYRKPTHTDRLLDESSYNPTSHKVTTINTLTRRAQLVCDTPDSLRDENRYLERVFHKNKNNYNTDFIRRNICQSTEADATLLKLTLLMCPFTQAIFVAATRCNFCRAQVATSKSHV